MELKGSAELEKPYNSPPENKKPSRIRKNLPGTAGILNNSILKYHINLKPIGIPLEWRKHNLITSIPD